MCILANCTLVLAWSLEEAGRYLETYKAYELSLIHISEPTRLS